jgi:uncharacterized protein (TIGR00730 family)
VPAFAVGRSQALLVALRQLRASGAIPDVPIFLDSPMAVAATSAYLRDGEGLRLGPDDLADLGRVATMVGTTEESKALSRHRGPCVLVSAAGMLTGGRVLHHFARLAPDPRNTILVVGYQAVGTRGASLVAGERRIKVHGALVPVRARVVVLESLSAHADQQGLLDWLAVRPARPAEVVLNHGEPASAEALRRRVQDELGIPSRVAQEGERFGVPVAPAVARSRAPVPEAPDGAGARLQRILASSSYVRADLDLELLGTDELRGTRLMLEFLKTDQVLRREGIDALVAVFGSARIEDPEQPGLSGPQAEWSRYYGEARAFGRLVGSEPFDGERRALVVTGGGPGVMEAACRGSFEVGARAVGLNITLEHEQVPNSYLTPELTFQFRYFGIRKMHFLARAIALVAFPGGFGTADEVYETLTLMQAVRTGRIPVVLVGAGYWERVLPLGYLVEGGFITEADAGLVTVVDTGQDAWDAVRRHYASHRGETPAIPLPTPGNA